MEFAIVKFFNRLGWRKADAATRFVSWIPFLFFLWAGIALLLLFFDAQSGVEIFVAICIATAAHFAISEGLMKILFARYVFKRERPYIKYPGDIFPLGKEHSDSSFPSSHMATTLAVLTIVAYFYPIVWLPASIFIIFMAYARMHNGMHYLSDVLAGAALGVLYGVFALFSVGF